MINEKTWCFSPETYALLRKKQTAEIDAWLDEHVAQETGYVLDDSLTLENAAAQAKAVGDEIARIDNAIVIGMNTLANAAWGAVNTAYTAGKAVFAYTYSNHPVLYGLVDCYEESMNGYERKDFIFRAITASNSSGADVSTVLLKRTGNGVSYEYEWSNASTVSLASHASLSAAEQKLLASFPTDDITNAAVASFPDGADGIPVKRLIANVEPIQSGAGDPSPGNVRSITGRTLAYVRDTGKNLFDADGLLAATGWVKNADGSYSGMSANIRYDVFDIQSRCVFKVFIVRKLGMNFTFSAKLSAGSQLYVGMSIRNKDTGATRNKEVDYIMATSVTLTSDCAENEYVQSMWFAYGNNKSITMSDIQLEIGTTATAYVPFSGVTHTINFPAAAGTVYGGTLRDNGDGTWTLKARPYYASFAGEALIGPWVSSMDVYAEGTTPTTGAQVVDLGGAETEYTLTAESVKTLLGDNNIFADCGDVNALTYRADVGLYIDKKLAEA